MNRKKFSLSYYIYDDSSYQDKTTLKDSLKLAQRKTETICSFDNQYMSFLMDWVFCFIGDTLNIEEIIHDCHQTIADIKEYIALYGEETIIPKNDYQMERIIIGPMQKRHKWNSFPILQHV